MDRRRPTGRRSVRLRDSKPRVPRTASWAPSPDRQSPVDILAEQDESRVADLVPVRYGRMLDSRVHVLPRGRGDHGRRPGHGAESRTFARNSAETRISPTSEALPRRTAVWCSTSTTSTRRSRARSSGTSSGSPPASRSRVATAASTSRSDGRPCSQRRAAIARRCAASRRCATSTSGTRASTSTRSPSAFEHRVSAADRKRFSKNVAKARNKDSLRALGG